MASNETSHDLLDQISEAPQNSPDAFQWWSGMMTLGTRFIAPPALAQLNLADSEKYVKFAMSSLGYAISPHARRPNFAAASGIHTRAMAWMWVEDQTGTHAWDDQ